MRGALLMMAAMASFTINDTFMKSLSGDLPLFQALFVRGAATTVFLYAMAKGMSAFRLNLSGRDWVLLTVRSLAEVAAAYLFISALFHMPLANVTAILQALPLTIALAGAIFLREAVGWRRIIAICVGFFGVMLIVRPGPEGFSIYSLYALGAVAAVTLRDLTTRRISHDVPALTVAFAAAAAVTVFSGLGLFGVDWIEITPLAGWKLAGSTLFVVLGYLCSVSVMRVGDIDFVAPFRYTGLIWALLLGFVIFDEWPRPLTMLGVAIVAGTGFFTLYRERRMARPVPEKLRIR